LKVEQDPNPMIRRDRARSFVPVDVRIEAGFSEINSNGVTKVRTRHQGGQVLSRGECRLFFVIPVNS
jgi:hypothetical protein